jgi:uncharacterized protein (DUF433 family)
MAYVSDAEIQDGAICFAGTRVPVSAVQAFIDAGYSDEEIAQQYPTVTVGAISAFRIEAREFVELSEEQAARVEELCANPPPITPYLLSLLRVHPNSAS